MGWFVRVTRPGGWLWAVAWLGSAAWGQDALPAADQHAFRRWFCFIAETAYHRVKLPAEINDCAALVRYSYREALKKHTPEWKRHFAAPRMFDAPDVAGWQGAPGHLFFTGRGWADFADALALRQFNSRLTGREDGAAKPADLMFFYQPEAKQSFHLMIFLGGSEYGDPARDWVVYHTGESAGVKKVRRSVLLRHPDPRWRPEPGNAAFLGYYRLKLLE